MSKNTLNHIKNLKIRQVSFARLSAGLILCSGVSCVALGINNPLPAVLAAGSLYCCQVSMEYCKMISEHIELRNDVNKNKQKVKRY